MSKDLNENICEEQTFKHVYTTYSKDLHDFLYYKFGEGYSPNDKTQEAFIKLWENCKKVTLSKARSFLFTVANNLMLNDIKHQKVVLKHKQVAPKSYTNETPEFVLEKAEYLKQYQEILAHLTEEQRVAFLLNKVEGKRHAEIAEMLGVTRKVVEYRIYSAFSILKERLEEFKIK